VNLIITSTVSYPRIGDSAELRACVEAAKAFRS
jgi:hypothetical protein